MATWTSLGQSRVLLQYRQFCSVSNLVNKHSPFPPVRICNYLIATSQHLTADDRYADDDKLRSRRYEPAIAEVAFGKEDAKLDKKSGYYVLTRTLRMGTEFTPTDADGNPDPEELVRSHDLLAKEAKEWLEGHNGRYCFAYDRSSLWFISQDLAVKITGGPRSRFKPMLVASVGIGLVVYAVLPLFIGGRDVDERRRRSTGLDDSMRCESSSKDD